ncbi:hypothetical protein ABGN05_13255 [Aquibium sp. LZ166]|uniref:Molecular chaperone DnaJ n=1 Tax=Aquibium pacificus TaxID=3153579 RepID=A0ABV3SIV0_9HYPH
MTAFTTSEFTSLLDELLDKSEREKDGSGRPSVPFGYVAPKDAVEELWASMPSDFVTSVYRDTGDRETVRETPGMETPEASEPPLPSIEPDAIAAELRMANARWPRDFDRIRREFAMANHPDRAEPRLRDRAVIRMQIANMLIDQEKRRLAGRR